MVVVVVLVSSMTVVMVRSGVAKDPAFCLSGASCQSFEVFCLLLILLFGDDVGFGWVR